MSQDRSFCCCCCCQGAYSSCGLKCGSFQVYLREREGKVAMKSKQNKIAKSKHDQISSELVAAKAMRSRRRPRRKRNRRNSSHQLNAAKAREQIMTAMGASRVLLRAARKRGQLRAVTRGIYCGRQTLYEREGVQKRWCGFCCQDVCCCVWSRVQKRWVEPVAWWSGLL